MQNANELFNEKWPVVQRMVGYWGRWRQIADREDLSAIAASVLWEQCQKLARGEIPAINKKLVRSIAWARWKPTTKPWLRSAIRSEAGHDETETDFITDRAVAPDKSIEVDGVKLTTSDVEIDHPRAVHLWRNGVGVRTVARRLGVSRQYVTAAGEQLGGVRFHGGERGVWRFPPKLGLNGPPANTAPVTPGECQR